MKKIASTSKQNQRHNNLLKLDLLRLPEEWDNFFSSVILVILLPLLPLLLEFLSNHEIAPASLTLSASFFTLALGASSKSKTFFAFSVFVGVVFAPAYIIVLRLQEENIQKNIQTASSGCDYISLLKWSATIVIFLAIIIHGWERYIRHIKDKPGDPFLNWWYGKEEIKEKRLLLNKLRRDKSDLTEQEKNLSTSLREKESLYSQNNEDEKLINEIYELEEKIKDIQGRIKILRQYILTLEDELRKLGDLSD